MHSLKVLALMAALACAATAQTTPPQSTTAPKPAPAGTAPASPLAPDAPVITIENLCTESNPKAGCKTVVTKAEFDRLLGALKTNVPPSARLQVAHRYVELLTFADKGEQAGLAKTPEFQEQMQVLRMQALASAYNRYLKEKYANPSEAEVEAYYRENQPAFEKVTLKRIYIPKPPSGSEKKPPLDEAATKALAEKVQARAAAGEDFDKLQEEAFVAANPGVAAKSAPPTTLGPRRRGELPASQENVIFSLASGQVSALLDEPSGYFIYKLESKQVLPLAEVKGQIERQLEEQKMRDAMQETINSVKATYDESYFKVPAREEATPTPTEPQSELKNPGKARPGAQGAPAKHPK